jgi:hypothetical protein
VGWPVEGEGVETGWGAGLASGGLIIYLSLLHRRNVPVCDVLIEFCSVRVPLDHIVDLFPHRRRLPIQSAPSCCSRPLQD